MIFFSVVDNQSLKQPGVEFVATADGVAELIDILKGLNKAAEFVQLTQSLEKRFSSQKRNL